MTSTMASSLPRVCRWCFDFTVVCWCLLAVSVSSCQTRPTPQNHPRPAPQQQPRQAKTCAQRLSDSVEFRGQLFDQHCYREVGPKCGICHTALIGPVTELGLGYFYHKRCFVKTPRCSTCSLPAAGLRGELKTEQGLSQCGHCRKRAVQSQQRLQQLITETKDDLRALGLTWRQRVHYQLCDLKTIQGFGVGHNPHGLTVIDQHDQAFSCQILVLRGLPETLTRGVLAHEMFHVWQHENHVELAPKYHEGSASYIQWLLYRQRSANLWLQLIELNPDPVYGAGFREFRAWVAGRPARKWLKMLIAAKNLPSNR